MNSIKCWTEDNRLQAVKDPYMGAYYNYDASGERNLKLTGATVDVTQNGQLVNIPVLDQQTLYASALVTVNDKGYTKHYFEEGKRICSKIGNGGLQEVQSLVDEFALSYEDQQVYVKDGIVKTFDKCMGITPKIKTQNFYEDIIKKYEGQVNSDEPVFYYHSDHLGSASYITDDNGNETQHLVYLPFGEDWVDLKYNTSQFETPFKFNGKEKDTETGYNNYGARFYYDYLSIFLSTDPMSDKYPSTSSYAYCANNPVMLIDPDGRDIVVTGEASDKYVENLQSKNVTITRNSETGALTHSYNKGANYENITKEERMLVDAITSPEVTTNIVTGISKDDGKYPDTKQSRGTFTWSDGNTYGTFGGSFMGTEIDKKDKNGKATHAQSYNYVDPYMLDKESYNQGAPHEASEGYNAGLISIKNNEGILATPGKVNKDKNFKNLYNKAHSRAIPDAHTSNYLFGIKINKNSPFKNVKQDD